MTYVYAIIDPILGSPVWVDPSLEAAQAAGQTLGIRERFENIPAPIYRFEKVDGKKTQNSVKFAKLPALRGQNGEK